MAKKPKQNPKQAQQVATYFLVKRSGLFKPGTETILANSAPLKKKPEKTELTSMGDIRFPRGKSQGSGGQSSGLAASTPSSGPPINSFLPVITGTTAVSSTLTTTDGTWTNALSFSYQWMRDNVNISGASASTYLLTAADIGAVIAVKVTATGDGGSTLATSAAVGPVTAAIDANWYKRWQYAGNNPTAVCDFANSLYWNGTTTSTNDTGLISGTHTITPGTGMQAAGSITAIGALLAAFQTAEYTMQVSTWGGTAGNPFGIVGDNAGNVYAGTGAGGTAFFYPPSVNLGAFNYAQQVWQTISLKSGIRRMSATGANRTVSDHTADTGSYAVPTRVDIGSWTFSGTTYAFDGKIGSVAIIPKQTPAITIPPPAFTGPNGFWWNYDGSAVIDYGNILQFEWNTPWTSIAAINLLKNVGGGSTGVTGIIFCNVLIASPYTGYELWIDGNGFAHMRIMNAFGVHYIGVYGSTNLADGKWHVVATTYDGSGLAAGVKIYVDGILETMVVESDNLGGLSIVAAGQDFMIGNQQATTRTIAIPGAIGLYRHYNGIKSLAYIQSYQINKALPDPSTDPLCLLAPALDEGGASTTTRDLSSGNHTGTLSSSSFWLRG